MFPERLLAYSVKHNQVLPRFLDRDDEPWLGELLGDVDHFVDRPERELLRHLKEHVPAGASVTKLRMAVHVLERLWSVRTQIAIPATTARTAVFGAAAGRPSERDQVLQRVAADFNLEPLVLEQALFADLPGERRLTPAAITTADLALKTNQALAEGLLYRAQRVHVEIEDDPAPIVRLAKRRRLICTAKLRPPAPAVLDISGPMTLFRHTRLYGHALAELLHRLAMTTQFRLLAWCALRGRLLPLTLQSSDPIFAPRPDCRERRLDERFAKQFAKLGSEWRVSVSPPAIDLIDETIFPDVLLEHPDGRRRVLDFVGFWTAASLHHRLAQLRRAGIADVLLCVDEDLDCSESPPPNDPRLLRYRGRLNPASLLAAIES